jgi:hypothetical protein
MPITVVDFPAVPECNGTQWSVADEEQPARLTALVMIGRSHIVANVLHGAQRQRARKHMRKRGPRTSPRRNRVRS